MPEFIVAAEEVWSLIGATEMGQLGIEIAGTSFTMGQVAMAAASIGSYAYSTAQARSAAQAARNQFNAAQIDRLNTISSNTAPRELVMGRVRKSGAVVFKGSTGVTTKELYMVLALAAHEIDAVEAIYLNDVLVSLDGSGNVLTAPYNTGAILSGSQNTGSGYTVTLPATYISGTASSTYTTTGSSGGGDAGPDTWTQSNNTTTSVTGLVATAGALGADVSYQYYDTVTSAVRITTHLGASGQTADSSVMSAFPSLWTSSCTGDGIAYIVAHLTYSETAFPSGVPALSAVVRGAKIYDPRSSATVWTENPALMMRHVYQHPKFGKATVTASEDVRFIAAANACDTSQSYTESGLNYVGGVGVNYLANGSAFDSASWSKASVTVTPNVTPAAPDGTTTADKITSTGADGYLTQAVTIVGGSELAFSVWLRADAGITVPISQTSNGVTTSQNCALNQSWQQFVFPCVSGSGATSVTVKIGGGGVLTSGWSIYAWNASLSGSLTATHALFRASYVTPFGNPPRNALDDLSQAMAGQWAFAGGEFYLKAGTYTSSVKSFADSDLAVVVRDGASETQSPISISVHKAKASQINTIKAQIWDQEQAYKQVSLTPLQPVPLLARDGIELSQSISYAAIGYSPQALHVSGILMRDLRDPLTVQLPFKLSAYPIELFDTIDLTLSRYGWVNKTFVVMGKVWAGAGTIQLTLKETDATITQIDAGFSAQGSASNTALPTPWSVADVGVLTVASGTAYLLRQLDGTIVSRMCVSWTQVPDISVVQAGQVEIQYRLASSSGQWTSLVVSGDQTQTITSDVQDGMAYVIRARAKTTLAIAPWGAQVTHIVVGKSAPPVDVASFAQTNDETGINLSWAASTDIDYDHTVIRVGASWAAGALLWSGTAIGWLYARPPTGTYTFWAKHFDTSSNPSTNATSLTVSYTLPTISNSSVTVVSGAIQGIGIGAGTVVDNSHITTNADGTLTGAGSGGTPPNLANIAGTINQGQISADYIVVNALGHDITSELRLNRTTGGWASLYWDGVTITTNKRFQPVELGLQNIASSLPSTPFANQMVLIVP